MRRGSREPGDPLREEIAGGDSYLCECFGRSLAEIRADVERLKLKSVVEVYDRLLRGGACRMCTCQIEKLLAEVWGPESRQPGEPKT